MRTLTLLAPLLLGAVDVVFELDADLPLVGLVPDEGVLEQLLGGRTLGVVLHQAALDEAEEFLRPVGFHSRGNKREARSWCHTPPPTRVRLEIKIQPRPFLRLEPRRRVPGDEEERPHWMHVAQCCG